MKRTNLVLDEQLLEEAVQALGVKTYSAAVNLALAEAVRVKKVQGLRQFFGKKLWQGDLSEMREDQAAQAPHGRAELILVDTSVWIALLNGPVGKRLTDDDLSQFVTTGPIVQEILQGLRGDSQWVWFEQLLLAVPRLSDPLPLTTFLEAANIYSLGRRQGYTIRSSTDCLIAAIAIENNVPVWHRDRDFDTVARFTRLQVHPGFARR